MFYLVYKITNKVDNKIYIGVHKTNNIDDGYMGSGKYLKRAMSKYGIDKFSKEILYECDSQEEMYSREFDIVDEEFVKRKDTYNIKTGGFGGFDYVNKKGYNLYGKNGKSGYGLENLVRGYTLSENQKEQLSKILKLYYDNGGINGFKGKKHTEEWKKKIGKINSIHQRGEGNSQYGTCWIYSLEEKRSMKIKKEELDNYIKDGWIKGRKMKFD